MERFQEKKQKQKVITALLCFSFLLLIGVIIYQSYALYEERKEYDVIKGSIPTFMSDYDVKIAILVDGVASETVPDKNSGKALEEIICDHGAVGAWDYQNWTLVVKNMNSKRTKCQLHFKSKYTESLLNGTDPVLKDGLIPITIENDGTVKKASLGSEWYRYENKKWANAIILEDESIVYGEGEVIPESNIESYFVWVPRYRYQIFDEGKHNQIHHDFAAGDYQNKTQEIQIVFESKGVKTSTDTGVGGWLTHPAFIAFDTNGLWVGKFETGYKGAKTSGEALKNEFDTTKVEIKPNIFSWRNINVSNAFQNSYQYKRQLESHMMKNTEWGAVAYLSHSKYGSMKKIRMNNHSEYKTGYAAVNEPTCGYTGKSENCNLYGNSGDITKTYTSNEGFLASTTGNISGIYDMSGGAFEYVMGVMKDQNGNLMSGRNTLNNSGFNGVFGCPTCDNDTSGLTELSNGIAFPDSKYYDSYVYNNNWQNYSFTTLGDATGEVGPFYFEYLDSSKTNGRRFGSWYYGISDVIVHVSPWIHRGSAMYMGKGANMFSFSNYSGSTYADVSYRIILSL